MGGKLSKKSSNLDQRSIRRLQRKIQGELSAEEIQHWYKAYNQRQTSGRRQMTKDEFKDVYNELFKGDATDFSEHVFRTFDLNNDGEVDFNEFLLGLCMAGSSDAETKITWAFKVYDIDGDGTITWHEMKKIIQSVSNMTSSNVIEQLEHELTATTRRKYSNASSFCPQSDSDTTAYEPRDRIGELADIIFHEMDSDKDGRITLEEFRDGALRLPCVINLLERNPDD